MDESPKASSPEPSDRRIVDIARKRKEADEEAAELTAELEHTIKSSLHHLKQVQGTLYASDFVRNALKDL